MGSFTSILVYIDDLVLDESGLNEINTINFLNSSFKIKDFGELKFFLGLEIDRIRTGISIYQRKYTLKLLLEIGYLDCKPIKTPIYSSLKPSKDKDIPLADITSFKS